jgi:hypothetical protein
MTLVVTIGFRRQLWLNAEERDRPKKADLMQAVYRDNKIITACLIN